ncbi:PAXIP1-associated glutamate-rich protein 1 [Centruroides vittatus]|uniref:PAXIP1-associated glutamate-rich protein 1 n=1 Tax=Centruroides vittatus TaxID=120091 RepID=UPI00350F1BC5
MGSSDCLEKGKETTESEEDWRVSCSDEEKESCRIWEPKPEEILDLYIKLEKRGILDLEWQCPGRRSPSVHSSESECVDRKQMDDEDLKLKRCEPNEFDFDDEMSDGSTQKITPIRRTPVGGSSSAQKRVARLDKVMLDIRRYRHLDEMDKKIQKPGDRQKTISNVSQSTAGN